MKQIQKGVSLIELMVGLTIGLITIAVAMGALISSRSANGGISDSAFLQQQASYAFRVIGQQIRQANSQQLVAVVETNSTSAYSFSGIVNSVIPRHTDEETSLTISYKTEKEKLFSAVNTTDNKDYLLRNCLGEETIDGVVTSTFTFKDNTLLCAGKNSSQPITNNIDDFAINYLVISSSSDAEKLQYINSKNYNGNGNDIYAIEICLVIFGSETFNLPEGSSFAACSADSVNYSDLDPPRNTRLHKAFKSLYQIRSQGV